MLPAVICDSLADLNNIPYIRDVHVSDFSRTITLDSFPLTHDSEHNLYCSTLKNVKLRTQL